MGKVSSQISSNLLEEPLRDTVTRVRMVMQAITRSPDALNPDLLLVAASVSVALLPSS